MVSRGRVPLYAVIAGDVTVHDRGRVASASVVHGRRDVAVASLGVAVARRGRGCGVRRLCVAVVWLRHADEC